MFFSFWYNLSVMKNNTKFYYSPKQGRLPLFLADYLDICDPVLAFDQIMEEIGMEQYLKPEPLYHYGRPGYNRVNMLNNPIRLYGHRIRESERIGRPVQG